MIRVLMVLLVAAPTAIAGQAPKPTTRPYPTNHQAPLDAVVREVAQTPVHTQHHVTFNGIANGSRVTAFLYVPNHKMPKRPAILLQYGTGGSKTTRYIVSMAHQAVAHGFTVLTIDVPGRGERRNVDALQPRILIAANVIQTLGDYSRAIDYLASRDDIDKDRIAFVGVSWGAITGITFAAHDPRIKVMASLVGGGNFLGWLNTPLSPQSQTDIRQWDPVYHVPLIAPRPLLLLNVTRDQLVPRFFADSLQKAAGNQAEKMWLEADHFFNGVDRHQTLETVLNWVEKKLESASNGRPVP